MKADLLTLIMAASLWIVCGCSKESPASDEERDDANAKIELPKNLRPNQIEIYETGGNALTVHADGTFSSHSGQLLAVDKESRVIYVSYCSTAASPFSGTVTLNGTETAIALLLHAIPNSFEAVSQQQFDALKRLIADLPETQQMGQAIEQSVAARGYLEVDDIGQELQTATRALYEQSGISDFLALLETSASSLLRAGTPEYSVRHNGFRLDLMEKNLTGLQIWKCNFTAYSEWGCHLAVVPAILSGNNQMNINPNDLRYVVPPANTTHFRDGITSWETQKQFWTELYQAITRDDFGTGDWTWDKSKLEDIRLDFVAPEDVIVILSPRDSPFLLGYNIFWFVAKPIINSIFENMGSTTADMDFIQAFLQDLVTDELWYQKMQNEEPDFKDITLYLLKRLREHLVAHGARELFPRLVSEVAQDKALDATLGLCATIEKWVTVGLDGALLKASLWEFRTFTIDPQLPFVGSPTGGLVAHYPFNGNANDESGHGNHGTVHGATLTTDRRGYPAAAYHFGGFYDKGYIKIPLSASLQFDREITLAAWIKLNDRGGMEGWGRYSATDANFGVLSKDGGRNGISFDINSNGGLAFSYLWDKGSRAATMNYTHPAGFLEWTHVAAVNNGSHMELYLNGVKVQEGHNVNENVRGVNTLNLYIGVNNDLQAGYGEAFWYPFNGKIDDVRLYNKALTAAEIQAVYESN